MSNDPFTQNSVEELDFLPEQFRRQHAERQVQPWRILAVCVAAVLVIGAAAGQSRQRVQLESDLAVLEADYQQALRQKDQLVQLQTRLQRSRAAAELFVYLKFPWPRTQLLSALAGPLPQEITFDEVHILSASEQGGPMLERRSRAETSRAAEQLAKLPPAAQDLARLREQWDKARCTVVVVGSTTDSMALHRYLAALAEHPLIADVELDSMETLNTGRESAMHFQATLTVRPGYGQPNGPDGPLGQKTAAGDPGSEQGRQAASAPAVPTQGVVRLAPAASASLERSQP